MKPREGKLILHNARIYTVNDANPWAEALVIDGEKIVFVGKNEEALRHKDENSEEVDLGGRLVLPGFHDVHAHVLEAGSEVGGTCTLDAENTLEENIALIRECDLTSHGTDWILGWGHSLESLLESERSPVSVLDELIPDVPAAFMEATSHSVWVNSEALARAGIDKNTPDPRGGIILKDTSGEPNGILIDAAGELVFDLAYRPSPEVIEINYEGLLWGLEQLAKYGITSVCDARAYWKRGYLEAWERAESEDTLTARVILGLWAYPTMNDEEQIAKLKSFYRNDRDSLLRMSQVKLYSDGIIHNATAALLSPYDNSLPGIPETGVNYFDQKRLERYVRELQATGFDLHIHTIGARATREALNAIEAHPKHDARHRLTHLEMVHPDDRARFKELGVVADFQVAGEFALPKNQSWNEHRIGKRAYDLLPVRSVYDTGAVVTLSSDWDVSTLNPFVGLQHSLQLDRQSLPDVAAAVRAYTMNPAYAMRQEDRTGSLEVGKLADLIVVDRNIFEIPVAKIGKTKVLTTILGGEVVHGRL